MSRMNYNTLRGRIRECGFTQKEVAARIGVSEGQFNRKLAGEFAFRQDEMEGILKLLEVDMSELSKYFFTPNG